jgi:hypothetical protein
MSINDNLLEDALNEVGNEKSDIDKVITISSQNKKESKAKEKKPNNKVGVYITDAEKRDFMKLCGFHEKRATEIGRELILKFIKENNDTLHKLAKLKSM